MLSILTFSPRTSLESVNFEAFLVWIKHKEEIVETTKNEMLNAFDLNKFDKAYLLNKVRRTGYFADEAIFDVLEVKVAEVQKQIRSLEASLSQAESKNMLLECEMQRWSNLDMNKFKKQNIVGRRRSQIFNSHFGTFTGLRYAFDKIESINNIQFNIDLYSNSYSYSYSIESSVDGYTWVTIADFSNCKDEQNVYFPMQDMVYLCIRLKSSLISVLDDSVVFKLDTKSGERKNKTS